jgi:hypothetical protein
MKSKICAHIALPVGNLSFTAVISSQQHGTLEMTFEAILPTQL